MEEQPMQKTIYLDNHATTPLDPRVLDAMLPYFGAKFGNPASRTHRYGWESGKAVDFGRQQVAELIGAEPQEIVFTSGATESNNLAIKGAAESCRGRGNHFITMSTEHKAVLDPIHHLEALGFTATILGPRPDGLLDLDEFRAAFRPETILASIMFANNEIGVVQPVREIGAICRERGVLFHCDAAQAFAKLPIDLQADPIDMLSFSGHKFYAPKGTGGLYARRHPVRVQLAAQMDGGGHENGYRSGTLNVPGIVGLGAAAAIAREEMAGETVRLKTLRDTLLARLQAALTGIRVNGSMEHRLPGNLNVSFAGVDGETLLMSLPDLALSTSSACNSGAMEASSVVRALGATAAEAQASVRFGLGRFTTAEEIDYASARVIEVVSRLRALSPVG
jgi:cysteine desulfurase